METELIFHTQEAQALVERIKEVRHDQQIHTAIALAVWLTYIFSRNPVEWIGALRVAENLANKFLELKAEHEEEE